MTRTEALELLAHHSFTHDDFNHPKTERGYLGMLRPFTGQLYEENFHEVIRVIKTLAADLRKPEVDKDIICKLWSICQLSRAWALEKDGMLQRNGLIVASEVERLAEWTDCISATVMNLLSDLNDEIAYETYNFYIEDHQ